MMPAPIGARMYQILQAAGGPMSEGDLVHLAVMFEVHFAQMVGDTALLDMGNLTRAQLRAIHSRSLAVLRFWRDWGFPGFGEALDEVEAFKAEMMQ